MSENNLLSPERRKRVYESVLLNSILKSYRGKKRKSNHVRYYDYEDNARYNKNKKFYSLLPDLLRLIALYFYVPDILKFVRVTKKNAQAIHKNKIFTKKLIENRLTVHSENIEDEVHLRYSYVRDTYEKLDYQAYVFNELVECRIGDAAERGYEILVRYLVENRFFDISDRDSEEYKYNYRNNINHATWAAVTANRFDILKYLYDNGAVIEQNSGCLALREAAIQKNHEIIEYLIKKGALVFCIKDEDWREDENAILRQLNYSSIENPKYDTAKYLIECDLKYNALTADRLKGYSYILYTFLKKHAPEDIVKYLISKGITLRYYTENQIYEAYRGCTDEMKKYLLETRLIDRKFASINM